MEPFRIHLFSCMRQKPEGVPLYSQKCAGLPCPDHAT